MPTATQVVSFGQITLLICSPVGTELKTHDSPLSDVVSAVPPPFVAIPTAVQLDPEKQETLESDVTRGCVSKLQPLSLMSPSIDGRFSTVPTATHVIALGQETSIKRLVPEGAV